MTAAFNLSQLANNVNTSGQLDVSTGATGTLAVANGGTGRATLTANNVLLGNGTTAVQQVAPGTSGNVLRSNGTTWQSSTIGDYQGDNAAIAFYGSATGTGMVWNSNGSATFTIPTGVTALKITVQAGGGSGGSVLLGGWGGGAGGGAGGCAIKWLTGLTPGYTLAVTIGAAGGASSVSSGTQTITTVSATAGSAGQNGMGTPPAGGAGGGAYNGTLNIGGQRGDDGLSFSNDTFMNTSNQAIYFDIQIGARGGSSLLGFGGAAQTRNVASTTGHMPYAYAANGLVGTGYGAGGGGAIGYLGAQSGGAGLAGVVIFEW